MQQIANKKALPLNNHSFLLIILIILVSSAFILSNQLFGLLLLLTYLALALLPSMFFWQSFILPELNFKEHFYLSRSILLNQFIRSPLILRIKNGEIEGDYLLLKTKPLIKLITVDHLSAVILSDVSDQKKVLFQGNHLLYQEPQINGSLYLGIRSLQIGPTDKTELAPKFSHETFAEYHTRLERIEETKTQLCSGDVIYPSLSVFYRIENSDFAAEDPDHVLKVFNNLISAGINQISSERLDDFIYSVVIDFWLNFCENKNLEQITNAFLNPVDLKILNDLGIKYQIYLNQILRI